MSETSTPLHAYGVDDDVRAQSQSCSRRGSLQSNATGSLLASSEGGTGREMIPVPEMEAFAERFGFRFVAHQIGDANRSARVERPFSFIENNFLAGRTFTSWEDLNNQARQWCDKVNSTYKKHIRAVPRELFAVERMHLKPLPAWIPEVYRLHQRTVDVEGYVSVNSIRYSVPVAWIGHRVEVRETRDKLEIEMDARHIVTHARAVTPLSQRVTLAAHA